MKEKHTNPTYIYRVAGVASVIAGLLFIVIQPIHPEMNFDTIESTMWAITHILTFFFPIFAILGMTGVYAKQYKNSSWWDAAGYILFFLAMILISNFAFLEAFVTPVVYSEAPNFVNQTFQIVEESISGPGYLGSLYQISGMLFLFGGLISAISITRRKKFAAIAGYILIVGILLSPTAAIATIFGRISAMIIGLGFVLLGYYQIKKG